MRSLLGLSLMVCVACLSAGAARPLVLVRDGRSAYSICLSAQASPSERRGAEELQKFLEQMSGARLAIITDAGEANGDLVLVGNSSALERLRLEIPFAELGPEGFALKTAGRHLVIAGGRQRGTMYGVYALLEKLGCRWFSRDVSRIPRHRSITVPPLDETQKPAFEYREPFFTEAFDKDWAARNKMNGANMALDQTTGGKVSYYPFVHTFNRLVPPDKYFDQHPEYFSLIDGKRRRQRSQLCLTNPEVLRLAVAGVLRWMEQHPEATLYSVSQNDWEGWCECDRCRQVEQEEGGAHSGPILQFVNALAAEVEKKHPDKLIDTLAYWYSEAPPAGTRPRPNVRIRLCPIRACEAHPYEQCPYNAEFMENLRGWARITNQLYIWHYVTNFRHYLLPFPNFDELAADIPMYRRHGVVGLFLEGAYPPGGGGENAELRSYVMARLLWNPHANVNQAIDEFLASYYGKAARAMRQYFELLHRQVRRPPRGAGQHIFINRSPELPEPVLRRARGLFRRAEAAAQDDATRARVRKARLSIDYYELLRDRTYVSRNGWYAPAGQDPAPPGRAPATARLQSRFKNFVAELRRFGINSIHEGVDLKEDERAAAALRVCRVAVLENEWLRVEVVPELNGRVIRLVDRKSGADAIRPADPGGEAAGLSLTVYPDFRSRTAVRMDWIAGQANARELHLRATAANGLELRRVLRLATDAPVLETQAVLQNKGTEAVPAILESRLEFNPGGAGPVSLTFVRPGGADMRKELLGPGVYARGSETYTGNERPDGEWRLLNQALALTVANRFHREQVERCTVTWRPAEDRVQIGLWSAEKSLAPGQTLTLETDYRLASTRPPP